MRMENWGKGPRACPKMGNKNTIASRSPAERQETSRRQVGVHITKKSFVPEIELQESKHSNSKLIGEKQKPKTCVEYIVVNNCLEEAWSILFRMDDRA